MELLEVGGGRRGRRVDYYYHYPRDTPARRTKQQSVALLQQAMYRAGGRLRRLALLVQPYATHMAFRVAILDGKLAALRQDLLAIWSMAANNQLTITYRYVPCPRVVARSDRCT